MAVRSWSTISLTARCAVSAREEVLAREVGGEVCVVLVVAEASGCEAHGVGDAGGAQAGDGEVEDDGAHAAAAVLLRSSSAAC